MKMQYEELKQTRPITGLQTQQRKPSTTINKMTTGQITVHLYKRHEILILQVTVAVIFTWAFVTKLG